MTEDEYVAEVARQRLLGRVAVDRMLIAWRRCYWLLEEDPIALENESALVRAEMAARAYWGVVARRPTYGGVCGA